MEAAAVDLPTAAHDSINDSMVKARAPAARACTATETIRVRQLLVVHKTRRVLILDLVAVIKAVIIIPRLRRKTDSGHHVAGAARADAPRGAHGF